MNPLERTLIEKTGHDNGFEHTLEEDTSTVTLASARHRTRAIVAKLGQVFNVRFHPSTPTLLPELHRSFSCMVTRDADTFRAESLGELSQILRRAASLSQALPTQAVQDYQTAVSQELAKLPPGLGGTDVERLVRQRLGQERFRAAMLDYWGDACAVTGVTLPAVLRASHAKPWVECASDAERLNVFNGFLLTANLDALFDRFLISFDEVGLLLISPRLTQKQLQPLGIHPGMKLRWLTDAHRVYLTSHQARFQLLGVLSTAAEEVVANN